MGWGFGIGGGAWRRACYSWNNRINQQIIIQFKLCDDTIGQMLCSFFQACKLCVVILGLTMAGASAGAEVADQGKAGIADLDVVRDFCFSLHF